MRRVIAGMVHASGRTKGVPDEQMRPATLATLSVEGCGQDKGNTEVDAEVRESCIKYRITS